MRWRESAEGAEDAERAEPPDDINRLTEAVIGAAIDVHRVLGPGFFESFYEQALCVELQEREIPFVRQATTVVFYKGVPIGEARLDLVVDDRLLVELKAVDRLTSVHVAQVLSYLKVTNLGLGLLVNFNVLALHHGVRRVVRAAPRRSASSAPSAPSPLLPGKAP